MEDMGLKSPSIMSEDSAKEMHYPHVTLEWDKEYDLPASGTITFKFKKASETTNPNPKNGQPKQRVELDLTSLESVDEEEVADTEEDDSGEVLDKAAKKAVKKSAKETMDDGEDY